MIKILIVEDSLVMQQLLIHAISSDPMFNIIGVSNNGEEAIEAIKESKPDIIAMDWQMPKLDGYETTKIIMETNPIPIVIVTASININDVAFSFSMMDAGALAVVKKPPSVDHSDYKKVVQEMLQTLKLMSEVKLVRRVSNKPKFVLNPQPEPNIQLSKNAAIQIISIGASTGGPLVLQRILSQLPKNIPVPILIVQHISQGFTEGFVEWLKATTHYPLHIATHGEYPLPGHGYIAPDNNHMGIEIGPKIVLSQHEFENGLRPSVAYLFRTSALTFGSKAIGILLTGMGRDGADELKLMKDCGAITFAQDKESSVVHGMPGEAIKLNAAMHILSPEDISKAIGELFSK